jgi:DNA-binding NarL/FixJ family response regulator
MPGQPCIDTLGRILAIDPEALVVVLSSTESDRALSECLSAGAQSNIRKPFTRDEFVEFLRGLRRVA